MRPLPIGFLLEGVGKEERKMEGQGQVGEGLGREWSWLGTLHQRESLREGEPAAHRNPLPHLLLHLPS